LKACRSQRPSIAAPVEVGGLEVGRDETIERDGEDLVLVVLIGLL
jgi:hypothetical protein